VLRLHEVIENLITNAIEYTASAGTVQVTVIAKDTFLDIQIKDAGIGLSEQDTKKLFTKFFRSEEAVKYNPEGSGLGLYVVKSYVEGWGGRISVISKKGVGSTFTVSLPMGQKINERR
jgi:signal transduction histidine kinase